MRACAQYGADHASGNRSLGRTAARTPPAYSQTSNDSAASSVGRPSAAS